MAQNGLDYQQLLLEIDARDEPVFVSADVEDQRAGSRCVVGCLERLFDCRKMRPDRGASDDHKPLQRLPRGWVFPGKSRDNGLAKNPHTSDVPNFGSTCQGAAAGRSWITQHS